MCSLGSEEPFLVFKHIGSYNQSLFLCNFFLYLKEISFLTTFSRFNKGSNACSDSVFLDALSLL